MKFVYSKIMLIMKQGKEQVNEQCKETRENFGRTELNLFELSVLISNISMLYYPITILNY